MPEMFSRMPCVRCPPWARSRPRTVSPGSSSGEIDRRVGLRSRSGAARWRTRRRRASWPGRWRDFPPRRRTRSRRSSACRDSPRRTCWSARCRRPAMHGGAGVVLAGDHFQAVLLALDFIGDCGPNFGIGGGEDWSSTGALGGLATCRVGAKKGSGVFCDWRASLPATVASRKRLPTPLAVNRN